MVSLRAQEITAKLASESIDVTLPGRTNELGGLHLVTVLLNVLKAFGELGFAEVEVWS